MKKLLLIMALVGGMALTSCDEEKTTDEGVITPPTEITDDTLLKGATFVQYDKVGEEYIPSADGNYIQFRIPNVSIITVYVNENDERTVLYSGLAADAMFYYEPLRGSDSIQTIYFSYRDGNNKEIVAKKQFTVKVPAITSENLLDGAEFEQFDKIGEEYVPSNDGNYIRFNIPNISEITVYVINNDIKKIIYSGRGEGMITYEPSRADEPHQSLYFSYTDKNGNEIVAERWFTFKVPETTSENLLDGAYFAQFDKVGNDYVPSADGNYIQFNIPKISDITVYNIQNGVKKTLYKGKADAMFYYLPARGSNPVQTLFFSCLNENGKEIVAEKQFTLKVAQTLDPALEVLVSESGSKKWYWKPTSVNNGAVWGNCGYAAGAQSGDGSINGSWWGCGPIDGSCLDSFSSQSQQAGNRWNEIQGECYINSYMEFREDGTLSAHGYDGVMINNGTFSIKDYNKNNITNMDNFSRGTLNTSPGAILWPFAINSGGSQPESFEIGWLDEDCMILIYATPGTGGWGECTWWSFGKK